MFANRSGKSFLIAGFLGAAAGIYLLTMYDSRTNSSLKLRRKNMMRGMQRRAYKLGNVYHAGKTALQEGARVLRH